MVIVFYYDIGTMLNMPPRIVYTIFKADATDDTLIENYYRTQYVLRTEENRLKLILRRRGSHTHTHAHNSQPLTFAASIQYLAYVY